MAEVTVTIGDRRHTIACRDGEESMVQKLAGMIDERWPAANRASGGLNAERTMLFVALMMADDLSEAERVAPTGDGAVMLEKLAGRLEQLASALEAGTASA